MNQIIESVFPAIISGILATVVTLFWQNRAKKLEVRKEIFTTLMAYRYRIADCESVKALNCVQAVFYDCPKVQTAWKSFLDAADKKPFVEQDLIDAHIQLLEEISKVLKYKNIGWKDIKRSYYPDGLASELNDTNVLRKAQLEVALHNVAETRKKTTDNSSTQGSQQGN